MRGTVNGEPLESCAGSRVAFRLRCMRPGKPWTDWREPLDSAFPKACNAAKRSGRLSGTQRKTREAPLTLPFAEVSDGGGQLWFQAGQRANDVGTQAFIHWRSMHKARLTGRAVSLKTNRPDTAPRRAVRLPFESPLPCPFLSGGGTTLRAAAQPPFFFAGWAGRLPPMVETLRAHGFTLLLLLNTLVVGLLVGGALCATFICR
jgi:hypothetical protein